MIKTFAANWLAAYGCTRDGNLCTVHDWHWADDELFCNYILNDPGLEEAATFFLWVTNGEYPC